MIVITLTDCPPALRGDLTKWFQEVNTGVYVGRVSARVRDNIWKRVQDSAKSGRATMVFSTNNEQRMDFRVHNTNWEPIDFDGLKLILRPSPARIKKLADLRMGFSKAAKNRKARQMSGSKAKKMLLPKAYSIIDIETSGSSPQDDHILHISALVISEGEIQSKFNSSVKPKDDVTLSTNINEIAHEKGTREIAQVLPEFLSFIGDLPVVSHNGDVIFAFLRSACERCRLPLFSNQCLDILALARRLLDDVENYKLETLLEYFKVDPSNQQNCLLTTKILYDKLIEIHHVLE